MPAPTTRIALLAKAGTSPWFTYSRIAAIYNSFGYEARMIESLAELNDVDVILTHNINGLNDGGLIRLLDNGVKVVAFIDTPYNKVATLERTDPRVIFVFTDNAYVQIA